MQKQFSFILEFQTVIQEVGDFFFFFTLMGGTSWSVKLDEYIESSTTGWGF